VRVLVIEDDQELAETVADSTAIRCAPVSWMTAAVAGC